MIVLDCLQRSDEWMQARAGIVTGSCFDRILTPAKLQPSAQATPYLHRLVAEYLIGRPLEDDHESSWQTRGTDMEPEARAWYAMERGENVVQVGFVYRDEDRMVGCSPDGLVGEHGGVEIKVPALTTHVGYLLDPKRLEADYRGQAQAFLWITGRRWLDLVSYGDPDSGVPSLIRRVEPDGAYRDALVPALDAFLVRLAEARVLVDAMREEVPYEEIEGAKERRSPTWQR